MLARYKTDWFSITVAPSLFIANAAGYGHDTVANGPAGNFSSVNTGGFTAPAKSDFLQFLDGTGEERDLFVVQAPGDITVKVGKIPVSFTGILPITSMEVNDSAFWEPLGNA
ncbi:MAG: hypothetical protein QOH31_658 [Verrucomicrobiota bacterium]